MRKTVLTFGLISGAIISAMMLVTVPFGEQIGFDTGAIIGYTSMVVAFLLIYFGIRSYRDSVAGGTIRFGRAFAIGALITAVAAVCYVATWQVVYYNFAPDFLEKYGEYAIEKERAAGASDAALAAKRAEMAQFAEAYQNPLVNIAYTFLEPLPVGLIITLVSAGVLSRRRREDSAVEGEPAVAR
jgi:hypothetical protein